MMELVNGSVIQGNTLYVMCIGGDDWLLTPAVHAARRSYAGAADSTSTCQLVVVHEYPRWVWWVYF